MSRKLGGLHICLKVRVEGGRADQNALKLVLISCRNLVKSEYVLEESIGVIIVKEYFKHRVKCFVPID